MTMAANGSPSAPPRSDSPAGSPRSASISLQAAAALNAGLHREPSRRSSYSPLARAMASPQASRRRSAIIMNLQLNDPSVPAPGEMLHEAGAQHIPSPQPLIGSPLTADPHHHRAPSLGELHQELEQEQEAQVNRLLQMIRQQQLELQRLQATHAPHGSVDEHAASSERPSPAVVPQPIATQSAHQVPSLSGSYPRSPGIPQRSSLDMSRRSRTPSRGASPRLRATSISADSGDWMLGGRDESAFYQAETQMLVRENQMLRHRIRELEKQLSESSPFTTNPSEPPVPSNLTRSSTSAGEETES